MIASADYYDSVIIKTVRTADKYEFSAQFSGAPNCVENQPQNATPRRLTNGGQIVIWSNANGRIKLFGGIWIVLMSDRGSYTQYLDGVIHSASKSDLSQGTNLAAMDDLSASNVAPSQIP